MSTFARSLRLQRLRRRGGAGLLVVPLDHSITDGPVVRDRHLADLVGEIADNGADAIVVHKGSLRHLDPHSFIGTSLIVHLSAGTASAADPDARCLVGTVAEALRLGADLVSVHLNLGTADEQRQLADVGAVGEACDRWSIPLLVMAYPRGPKVNNPTDPRRVAHAVAVAVDLGADLVKTVYPGSPQALADITRACPVPVLVAGGPRHGSVNDVLIYCQEAMRGGAAGVAIGRNIFDSPQPGATTRKLADLVHGAGERS